jgi:acyl carrier protein
MQDIDALKALIHEQFGIDQGAIDPDVPFATYDLDSLTLAELLFSIEDRFHVQVPDDAVSKVATLRDLATLLSGLRTA